jgi:tetratricopeptide (TPR) repeat protein
MGAAYLYRGQFAEATPVLEEGLSLCQATDIRVLFPYVGACLGTAYAYSGRLAEAIPLLERAGATAAMLKIGLGYSSVVTYMSQGYLLAGRTSDAAACAMQALELARANREPAFEARALWALGSSEMGRERFGDAENRYHEAMRLGAELGARPVVAHCHDGLANLYRRIGKQTAAEEHRAIAKGAYSEMGMSYWLEKMGSV